METVSVLPLLIKMGCGVDMITGEANTYLISWLIFSHLSTLIASWLSVKGDSLIVTIQSETSYSLLGILLAVINISVVILNRDKVARVVFHLQQPLGDYESTSIQSRIVKRYIQSNGVIGFVTLLLLTVVCGSRIIKSLIQMVFMNVLVLPFGNVPWSHEPDTLYVLCFLVSSTALISAALSHACWYLTFVYSSFLVTTELKLLACELRELDDRAKDFCEDLITPFHYLRRLKAEKDAILAKCNMRCINNIILEHNKIIRYLFSIIKFNR